MTSSLAAELNISLPEAVNSEVPFLGKEGCILESWQRIICTCHTCEIQSFGCKPNDIEWTKRYWELREQIMQALEEITDENNSSEDTERA